MINPEFDLHMTDRVTVPDACRECPVIADLGRLHDSLTRRAAYLVDVVMSGQVDAAFENLLKQHKTTEQARQGHGQHYKTGLRQVATKMVDEMHEQADDTVYRAQQVLDGCAAEGTLTMSAHRAGKQVVAIVCMSAQLEQANSIIGTENEPVLVRRSIQEN